MSAPFRTLIAAAAATAATLAVAAPAAPATAAPAAPGRQVQTVDCDGLGTVTVLSAPETAGDNWSAAQVVGGRTLVPVSFTYEVTDTTLGVVLNVDTVDHGAAHGNQSTITCAQRATVTLADLLPVPPGVELPAGAAPTDIVQMSFIVSVVPVGSER